MSWRVAACLFTAALPSACGAATRSSPPIVQPGAPGQASQVVGAEQARDLSKVGATPADVKFMQGMIHHHAQAIDMTELLKTRTEQRGHEEARPAHPGVADTTRSR